MAESVTANEFLRCLQELAKPEQAAAYERSLKSGEGDQFVGVRMGEVFALAKEFIDMPPAEIEELLESPIHEARAGALSVMDKQARRMRTSEERREQLFRLYLRRSDRIDYWDLVDIAAPQVVGRYLADRPRDVLYRLARSDDPWERRTAIVSTLYLVRQGDAADAFGVAEILVGDDHEFVQLPTGGVLREAGKVDRPALLRFLDRHVDDLSRNALRNATKHLDAEERERYLGNERRSR
jgi:3-methyladenine DNA glycosylase AlkD